MTGDSGIAPGPLALFCARLRCLQQASGISQASLARAAHLGRTQMSDILNGKVKRLPKWEITMAMVRASVAYAESKGGLISEGLRDESDWRRRYADVEHDLDAVVRSGPRRD